MLKIRKTCAHVEISFTIMLLAVVTCAAACGSYAPTNSAQSNGATSSSTVNASERAITDPSQLSAEIERLEREAEKNPGDDAARESLSRVYLKRGNLFRDAQKYLEAQLDYQRALRNDPDNEEAQKNIAAISPLVEGTPTAENGEPAPLPITPNVTDEDEPKPAPAKTPKKP